jgi:hypothetical protein
MLFVALTDIFLHPKAKTKIRIPLTRLLSTLNLLGVHLPPQF